MQYKYIIGGGCISLAVCFLIVMVLGSMAGNLAYLVVMAVAMAVPGMIVGAAEERRIAAETERKAREAELSELKKELSDIRALLEKQDKQ